MKSGKHGQNASSGGEAVDLRQRFPTVALRARLLSGPDRLVPAGVPCQIRFGGIRGRQVALLREHREPCRCHESTGNRRNGVGLPRRRSPLNNPPPNGKLSSWVSCRDCNAAGMKSSRQAAAFYLSAAARRPGPLRKVDDYGCQEGGIRQDGKSNGNGANLGFEAKLWLAADKLRNNMDAAEYKHVVLGLIFLKYISDAFEEMHQRLLADKAQGADPEDPDEYRAENVFWVPKEARWAHLQGQRQAADHRQDRRRRHGRHRARQPRAQGRSAQGLRPARARQAPPRRADRPDRHHRPGRARRTAPRTSWAGSTNTSSPSSPAPRARTAASSTRPAASSACWSRCSRPTRAASTTPAAAPAACSCRREKFIEAHGGRLGDISHLRPGVATPPPGGWP